MTDALIQRLRAHLPDDALLLDADARRRYGRDDSRRQGDPLAVALPRTGAQVAAIVQACRQQRIAITTRGAGTGTTGAAVPDTGSLLLSLERMNRIVRIDPGQRLAVVEPGVINLHLQRAAGDAGCFWPPDPASADRCSIGGNLACNAGGPRTVKYGATRDNVLSLTAVDGHGRLFHSSRPLGKLATGYNLTQLLVGSEGTLAVIVEATLRLHPLPQASRALSASFRDVDAAALAVTSIMAQAVTPSALEFLDGKSLRLARDHAGDAVPDAGALLLLEVDGNADSLDAQTAVLRDAVAIDGLIDFRAAADDTERERVWAARRALSPALRSLAPKKINEDVVVPVPRLPELIAFLDQLERDSGILIVCFGHAGNGNLHVNLMLDPDNPAQAKAAATALPALFGKVAELGGALSGEHGIGLSKRDFMPLAVDAVALDLMRGLKGVFDPDCILNPGKLLP